MAGMGKKHGMGMGMVWAAKKWYCTTLKSKFDLIK